MRPRSAVLCAVLGALALTSGCTLANPDFVVNTPPSVDGGVGGNGGPPLDETDAGSGSVADGGTEDDGMGSVAEDAGDAAPVVSLDGPGLESDVLRGDARGPDLPSAIGAGSLIGFWRFEDGPVSRTALDQSGYGHHGVIEGLDVSRAWVVGHSGHALEFPPRGADDPTGVQIPLSPTIDNLRAFTVGAWIYRKTSNGNNRLWTVISRQIADTDDEIFNLACNRTDLLAYVPRSQLGAVSGAQGSGAAPDGRWIYVAATYDGSVLRLYADGVQVGSGNYPNRLRSSSTPMYIGTNKNTQASEPFEGLIDEVVLFSRALSEANIKALVAGASPYGLQ